MHDKAIDESKNANDAVNNAFKSIDAICGNPPKKKPII